MNLPPSARNRSAASAAKSSNAIAALANPVSHRQKIKKYSHLLAITFSVRVNREILRLEVPFFERRTTMFQSRWGFHPCDYQTFRKLKFLNQAYLQAIRLAH